jgi:hypothetical protein
VRNWLFLAASPGLIWACSSSPNNALFTQHSESGSGASFGSGGILIGAGGAPFPSSGGASSGGYSASGGYQTFGTGGFPTGTGSFANTGGFGGSTVDGSLPTGGAASGGTGPVDSGTTGGGGSTGPADARPDAPDWCRVAHYTGELSGPYTVGLISTTFVAHLDFTVEFGGTVTGTLTGTSDTTSKATLTGSVDCSTGATSIRIVGGTYRNIRGTFAYEGTMTGAFDPGTSTFTDGKWKITEPASTGSGSGTWGASAN